MLGPNPRYRLYTGWRSYLWFLRDRLLGTPGGERQVAVLEAALAERTGLPHAVCTPMCRVGIHLALRGLIRPGSEVILSPYTIADVVNMVIAAGGRPRFADIEGESCNIDPAEVERLIGPATGAVLVTHLHGLAAPVREIGELCRRHGVPLLEDAAQAFGARIDGAWAGTVGDAGIYSLGTYKNINAWYGGAVATRNGELAASIRRGMHDWPAMAGGFLAKRIAKGLVTDLLTWPPLFRPVTSRLFRYGYLNDIRWINKRVETELDLRRHDALPPHYQVRLTPFQARLAAAQLDRIDADSRTRAAHAARYHELLRDLPGLGLPPLRDDLSHIYTYYPVQYRQRRELLRWLMRHGRDAAAQHLKNCADLPAFAEFRRDCPTARRVADEVILLPTYPRYGLAEVERTAAVVRDFFTRGPGARPEGDGA